MNRLVRCFQHGWCTMQNAIKNLLSDISNGFGLKSVGYCSPFGISHLQQQQIVFITVLYIPKSALFSTLQLYGIYSTLFSLIFPRNIYIYVYVSYSTGKSTLPDIYTRCPRAHSARGQVRIYQAKHECLCYN